MLGVVLLRESLGPAAVLGGALIVGAAVLFSYRAPEALSAS
jgi:drug/metabolite transporter (DMT)-like permease